MNYGETTFMTSQMESVISPVKQAETLNARKKMTHCAATTSVEGVHLSGNFRMSVKL